MILPPHPQRSCPPTTRLTPHTPFPCPTHPPHHTQLPVLSFYLDLMASTPLVYAGAELTSGMARWNITLAGFFRDHADLAARGTAAWKQQ